MLNKIPKLAVYVLLFLIPLFTLPFTSNVLDFQKQFLLFAAASLGFFFWVWTALSEKKLEVNRNPLHCFVAVFGAVILASSIFSLYSYGSLWGTPLPVSESFITIFSFILLYLLIVNNFKKQESYGLIAITAVSTAIAAVYAIIQSFGFYLLPFLDYTKSQSFNTIGTTNSLVLFAAIVLAAVFPLVLSQKNPYRRLMAVCGGIMFLAMVFFNSAITVYFPSKITGASYELSIIPWIILGAGALATFIFSFSNSRFADKNPRVKNVSFVLLFISLLFVVFNVFAKDMVAGTYQAASIQKTNPVMEAALRQQTGADIAINVLKQSSQAFFLGSGPGTFVYDYARFKPQAVSQDSIGWNLTFFAGSSEAINRIATTGLLGIIAFLLIIGVWTAEGFRYLTGEEDEPLLSLAVFSGWIAIVVAVFYYPFNLSLSLLLWLFMGLVILMDGKKLAVMPLKSVRLSYAVSLVFVAVTILELGLLVWTAKRYYAETQYLAAAKALQNNDLVGAIGNLESAANSTERLQDNYLTGLSQIYLARGQEELKKEGAKPEVAFQAAAPYFKTAVEVAMMSTQAANPNNSANWAVRAYVYREIMGISEGFDTWALDMYQEALKREPSNPSLWIEVGQVYAKKNEIDKAKESFDKAIILRPQYIEPHYYLALIADQRGDKESAIKELETVISLLPADDKTSFENVYKAIETLKEGGSLSGSAANGQSTDNAADGQEGVPPVSEMPESDSATGSSTLETVPAGTDVPAEEQPVR
jgi:tetratricopeptide (TPR) repeat protein